MDGPIENESSRFQRIRKDLSRLPMGEVSTRLDQLREGGESAAVISMLQLHCHGGQHPNLLPGRRLANRYTIKGKIGEGGMGVVYDAVHELTRQEVALKVIHPALVSSSLLKRFREEIRTLGKLQHDHIVRILDADYDRGAPADQDLLFYAMQLVHGLPLIRWAKESHPTIEARLECFIQVCDAVNYAHCRGVVHRDLKPDNILVDGRGRPAILDFGLAEILDLAFDTAKGPLSTDDLSGAEIAGTPAFMSPERWDGHPGGVPADVFALGVLLHELLTGSRPWRVRPGASPDELRGAICTFSVDQFKEHPALSQRLVRLLGSMLARDPAARPASAAAVATAVRAELARRRLKHRILRTGPIWAGAAMVVSGAIAVQSHYVRTKRQERESVERLDAASKVVAQHSSVDTLAQVTRFLPPNPKLRHSQDQWRDLVLEAMATWNLRNLPPVQLPDGFEPQGGDPQGTRFFGRFGAAASGMIERTTNGWVSTQFPGRREFLRARVNPRQPQLAVLTATGGLVAWKWKQNLVTELLPSAERETQFEFSPDGRWLACSATLTGMQGPGSERLAAVRVFDAENGQEVKLLFKSGDQPESGTSFLYVRSRPVAGLAFSPDSGRLAVWSDESLYLQVWDWAKERPVCYLRHDGALAGAAWRPVRSGAELSTIQARGQIRAWAIPTQPPVSSFLDLSHSIDAGQAAASFNGELAWTPGGEALAAVDGLNHMMQVFATHASVPSVRVPLGTSANVGIRWLSGGLLKPAEGKWVPFESEPPVRRILRIPQFSPSHLAFSSAGTILAASDNTRVVFFATTSGAMLAESEMPLSGITFDRTSDDFWAYNKNTGPLRWRLSRNILSHVPATSLARQSHVGQLAAAGGHVVFSRGTNIFVLPRNQVFDFGEERPDFGVDARPQQLAISANGQQVAAISLNPMRATLWRRKHTGTWVAEPAITNAAVLASLPDWSPGASLTLPPAQQRMAGSHSPHFGSAILLISAARVPMVAWLPDREQEIHLDYVGRESCIHVGTLPFERTPGFTAPLVLSPDGMRLASANSQGEIHVWDLRRAFEKLSEFQLGIEELQLAPLGPAPESPSSLTIAGPGKAVTYQVNAN